MAVAVKSRSSLHIEKYDFNELVLNKLLYLVFFSCINGPVPVKCLSLELITK